MTRLDALKELAAMVDAGTARPYEIEEHAVLLLWKDNLAKWDLAGQARQSYDGSLDAAKALHEAVLPAMLWQFTPLGACYVRDKLLVELGASGYVYPGNPARAWLLAIIRALISEAENEHL